MYGIDPIGDRYMWAGYGLTIHLGFCWLQQSQGGKYMKILWTISNEYWTKIGAVPPGTLQNISAIPKWNFRTVLDILLVYLYMYVVRG